MTAALKYFWLTLRHRWFVWIAGGWLSVSLWRRLTHDWTKLLPWNLWSYGRQFFGKADDPRGFVLAWLRHQHAHDHHWEYWIPITGHNRCSPPIPDNEPLEMSDQAIREMIADWLAAGRAYEGKWPDMLNWTWLEKNRDRMRLHPATAARIEQIVQHLRKAQYKYL